MMNEKQYRNPTPTVDVIIEVPGGIVMIERGGTPGGWALPGGFHDEGETSEEAAIREAKEETGLDIELKELLYVYSDPRRDTRKHTISVVYLAGAAGAPKAGDDAKNARVIDPASPPAPVAFDHASILNDYIRFRRDGRRPTPAEMLARIRR